MAERIQSLTDITSHYDVMLCDVWGVLHNGVDPFLDAAEALARARDKGASVVLITNSPRPNDSVAIQLDGIGVPRNAWDRIVTSGDVTRALIRQGPPNVYFLGPDRDLGLLDGTNAFAVKEKDADAIVCTGFLDDETETPEDYRDQLTRFADRNVPMICANPDLIVERGERLIPCAGAMAAFFETLGGETRIAGKPHRPIYEEALRQATELREMIDPARILAIGDGMPTDVRGAISEGLDLLYISAGIHARDYMTGGVTDERALADFLASHQAAPRWWMPRLA
ncbi:MAG: TIGR01459 family HAD-type hydrolase [Rhizobium sp.]|nr:TIGR01459 family HAD-type hydrolase [Rhizobium sp.]